MSPSRKKPKPSFEPAITTPPAADAAWVYRSTPAPDSTPADTVAPVVASTPVEPAPVAEPPAAAVTLRAPALAPAGVTVAPAPSASGGKSTGVALLDLLVTPFTLLLTGLLFPVSKSSARSRAGHAGGDHAS